MCPWDINFGDKFDVLQQGYILYKLAETRRLVAAHFATPCQSMSWGRLPQLRTWSYVLGVLDLTDRQFALVAMGNALAFFTVSLCFPLMAQGSYFSIENPCLSCLWALPAVRDLYSEETTAFTIIAYRDFWVGYVKPTAFLHNMPCMHELWRPKAELLDPIVLRGWIDYNGKELARTSLASRYLPDLAKYIAKIFKNSLDLRVVALTEGDHVPTAQGSVDDGFPLPEPLPGGTLSSGTMAEPPADAWTPSFGEDLARQKV